MRIIWDNGGVALYARITEAIAEKNLSWKNNTIMTLLLRLIDKGFLKRNKLGRRNEYSALVSEQEYAATQTALLVDKVYEGDVNGLINTLIERDMIPDADKERIIQTWRGRDINE
jgi:predicted transcriptional regulator